MRRKHKILLPALCALLVGCTTQQQSQRTAGTGSSSTAQPALASPGQSPSRDASSGGSAYDTPAWNTMAFPTGDPKTSVLAISKGLPEQVRLNQPFDYELTIENLTGAMLNDIVITDVPSADMSLEKPSPLDRTIRFFLENKLIVALLVVFFAGWGDVASRPDQLVLNSGLWTVGCGLRFTLDRQEQVKLRLDYGLGNGDSGFYLTLGEAF